MNINLEANKVKEACVFNPVRVQVFVKETNQKIAMHRFSFKPSEHSIFPIDCGYILYKNIH